MSSDEATCPQCGSTSIQAVPVPKKNLGDAVIAEYFLGTAAGVAAGTSTVIQAVCLKCGCQWFPGTVQETRIRALSGQLGEAARRGELERQDREKRRKQSDARVLALLGLVVFLALGVWLSISEVQEQHAAKLKRSRLVDSTTQAWSALQARSQQGKDVVLYTWNQYSIHALRGTIFLQRNGCGSRQLSCSANVCSHVSIPLTEAVSLLLNSGIPDSADKRLASGWTCNKERG